MIPWSSWASTWQWNMYGARLSAEVPKRSATSVVVPEGSSTESFSPAD